MQRSVPQGLRPPVPETATDRPPRLIEVANGIEYEISRIQRMGGGVTKLVESVCGYNPQILTAIKETDRQIHAPGSLGDIGVRLERLTMEVNELAGNLRILQTALTGETEE